MTEVGIVVVSHSKWIAQGVVDLISEVAKDVLLTYVGGTEDGGIGTSFEQVQTIVEANEAEKILAFFDLGSARMNLELVADFSDKDIIINNVWVECVNTDTIAFLHRNIVHTKEIACTMCGSFYLI